MVVSTTRIGCGPEALLLGGQVEYSLTGEGWDDDASAVSLRGLDAAVYYRAKGVLNCGHAHVRALILDSLRHWARTYNVDGFCFVNAETLTQGEYAGFACPALRVKPEYF